MTGTQRNDKKPEEKKVIHFPQNRRKNDNVRAQPWKSVRGKSGEPFFNFGSIPPLTKGMFWGILALYLLIFLSMDAGNKFSLYYNFGFVPASFTKGTAYTMLTLFTPLSSIFLHNSWSHLGINLMMFLCMGVYLERNFGTKKLLLCFLICGLAGNFAYLILSPFSDVPTIGASGAINGLFAITFLHLYERGLMGKGIKNKGPLPFILLWISIIMIGGFISSDISWQSHMGGFLSGVFLFSLWKKGYFKA